MTEEETVQGIRPKIADGFQKIFIFVERRQ
jgi:hypothetical protein